jgi:hypothetical protein
MSSSRLQEVGSMPNPLNRFMISSILCPPDTSGERPQWPIIKGISPRK